MPSTEVSPTGCHASARPSVRLGVKRQLGDVDARGRRWPRRAQRADSRAGGPQVGVSFCLAALAHRSRGVSACPAVVESRRADLLANVDGGEKTSNLETFSIDEVLRVPSPLSILCRRGPAIDSNHRELRRERRVYRKVAEPPKASCSKTIEHGTLSTFLFEIGVVARETVTWGGQVAKNSQ